MTAAFYTYISNVNFSVPLSDYRKRKLGRGQASDALQYSCEALLIAAFAAVGYVSVLPLNIKTDKRGKPYMEDGPFFSLSHSGNLILIAVSDREIGADIQTPVEAGRAIKIAGRFFTAEEARECPEHFTELWTRKEAYFKYTGEGINGGLERLSVLKAPDGLVFTDGTIDGLAYSICAHERCPAPVRLHVGSAICRPKCTLQKP